MGAHSMWTVHGGANHAMATLSQSEVQAARHALSKLTSSTGSLGASLGSLSQSATLIGGSVRAFQAPSFLQGSGSDTFVGGARSSLTASIGSDTIVGGSANLVDGSLGVHGTHNVSTFALSMDTINIAGATALSVREVEPEARISAHSVTVGDKTTVTISGLSAHDISKLSH